MYHTIYVYCYEMHFVFNWVKQLHDPNDNLLVCLCGNDYRRLLKVEKTLTYSTLAFKIIRLLCISFFFILYILTPLIRYIISGNMIDLLPLPCEIFLIDSRTSFGIIINILHQYFLLLFGFICLFSGSSLVFCVILHAYFFMDIVNDFIRYDQKDDKTAWIKIIVDATDQIKEYISTYLKLHVLNKLIIILFS